jgi:hypothetical protein
MDYAEIEKKMELWRNGLSSFPKEYIDYHKQLADAAIKDLLDNGYTIHRKWIDSDGWMDGMKTTFLIVETPSKHLKKLSWRDSHRKGAWFEHHQGYGGRSWHKIEDKDYMEKQREANRARILQGF